MKNELSKFWKRLIISLVLKNCKFFGVSLFKAVVVFKQLKRAVTIVEQGGPQQVNFC